MKRWSAVAIFAVVFPLFAVAEKSIPRAGETIEVSIVNLDVIVTDKKSGQRVHGLTKDDFEIFEQGKPQAITNFAAYVPESRSEVTAAKPGVSGPQSEAPKRQRRTIVVFIEDFQLPPFRVQPIFAALKKTLHSAVAPGDSVMIATYAINTIVRLDYTDDLNAIDKTLDQIAKDSSRAAFDPITNQRMLTEQMEEWFQAAADSASASGYSNAIAKWAIENEAINAAQTQKVRIRDKAAAINSFISTMSNDDGRKAMILMTRRLSRIIGGEYFYAIDPGSPLDTSQRNEYQSYKIIDAIKATANAHGVTIYAFYPPGLDIISYSNPSLRNVPKDFSGSLDHLTLDNELATLEDLTESTGGTMAWGSVDIAKAMPIVADDFEDYYSLAYRVSSRNDNRARNVTVRTKNPQYLVRTRKQYMEKNDDGRVRDMVIASLFRPPAPSGITVQASLGKPQTTQPNRYKVPVSLRVPASSLMTTQEGDQSKGAFSVYIATGRVVGEASDIKKQTIPFTVADVAKAKDGFFTYDFDLVTDFATNRLSVGVYDEVSHDSGFARVDLYELKK